MSVTMSGIAALIIIGLLLRGGVGRVGIIVAAVCGSVIGIFATVATVLWDLGGTIAELANSVGGGFG